MPGTETERTKITREVFSEAFLNLEGVEGLVKWAKGLEGTCTSPKNGNNLKLFYTLFAKTLPKEIKTEDRNKTHEQFIKWIQSEEAKKLAESGQPTALIEAPEVEGNNRKTVNIT